MTDTIISTIVGGSFGIFGAIIGAIVGGRMSRKTSAESIESSNANSIKIIKIQKYDLASAKLRATFAPALAKIDMAIFVGEHDLESFFNEAILVHAAAIEEFRPFASDCIAYQEAWQDYKNTIYDDDALYGAKERWLTGLVTYGEGTGAEKFLDVLRQKIKKILHFSKPINQPLLAQVSLAFFIFF